MSDELPAAHVILPAPYERPVWLKTRHTGIGGSDAPTALGMNPWKSSYELWLEKRGELVDDDDEPGPDDVRWWGNVLEDDIAEAFEIKTGLTARAAPGLLANNEHQWMLANPDRLVYDGDELVGLLEMKTTGAFRGHEWADDELPLPALVQTHHYLMTTGLTHAWVAGLVGGQKFICKEIDADPDLHRIMLNGEALFWQMVQDGTAPRPDGSEHASAAIRRRWAEATDDEDGVVLSPADFQELQQHKKLSAEIKALTIKRDAIAQCLQVKLGDRPAGYYNDEIVVRWSNVTTNRLDQSALKKAHPEIAAEFTRPTQSRRFTVVGKKG
jgi:putative phage-type endonuclease